MRMYPCPHAPNPFNPSTTIRWGVVESQQVRIDIYTTTGQHVRALVDGHQTAGEYSLTWDGADDSGRSVGSGAYVCRIETESGEDDQIITLLR